MKTTFTALILFLFVSIASAQAPNGFNYSAVARNSEGKLVTNSQIGIKISILKSSETGQVQYAETHSSRTDNFGVFNLIIGSGTVAQGNFENISWWNDKYFIKIEMDANGGNNYQLMGTSQLLSVPYAQYAKTAGGINGNNSGLDFWPRIGRPNQELSVSFSGGSSVTFTQSSTTVNCPSLTPNVMLESQQATSTIIYPVVDILYVSPDRFDALFRLESQHYPFFPTPGVYDVIISPGTECEYRIPSGFKIIGY